MTIVLDTNVVLSGVFFGGVPAAVLEACFDGRVQLVISPEILEEYEITCLDFSKSHPSPLLLPVLSILASRAISVRPLQLDRAICRDVDDDKFTDCLIDCSP